MSDFLNPQTAWRWATLILLLFFVIGAALIVAHKERTRLLEVSEQYIDRELGLLGMALQDPIRHKDYDKIRSVILEWGETHGDGSIVVLTATTPEGVTIAEYERERPQENMAYVSRRMIRSHTGLPLLQVETIRDFSAEESMIKDLRLRMLLIALAAVLALWLGVQYVAHRTLKQYEDKIAELQNQLTHIKAQMS